MVDGFLVFFYTLLWLLSLLYCYLYQPLTCLPFSSIQAQALILYYFFSAFSTCFFNISSLLQGCQFILLQGTLRSLHSLLKHILIYFIILELRSFCTLYIIAALIYRYRGGMPASFLSSAMAVCLYPPIILQKQAIWTFWSGLRSNLERPFLVPLMAQILDLYIIVSQTTTIYSRRDFQKYGPYIELTILDIVVYYTQPLRAAYAVYALYWSLLSTHTPNTLKP